MACPSAPWSIRELHQEHCARLGRRSQGRHRATKAYCLSCPSLPARARGWPAGLCRCCRGCTCGQVCLNRRAFCDDVWEHVVARLCLPPQSQEAVRVLKEATWRGSRRREKCSKQSPEYGGKPIRAPYHSGGEMFSEKASRLIYTELNLA